MKKYLLIIALVPFLSNPLLVRADEYVIEGNGSGSTNEISVQQETTTTVTQENTAEVVNNVDVNADTGNNEASANTGSDTNISTGDIDITSNVNNEGLNQSSVGDLGCCQGSTDINISGNGAKSDNLVAYNNSSNTNVNVNNSANITNNVNGSANTGNNKANYNSGSVKIATGDITVIDNINNKSVNNYSVSVANNSGRSITVSVKDNGTFSDNIVVINNENNVSVNIQSNANLENNSQWDLNTGNNEASGNNGDVSILTGDIYLASTINNEGINTGIVDIDCCEKPDKPSNPDPNPPVSPPGGGGGSSSGGGGSSSGSSSSDGGSGPTLPVTGAPSLLLLALVNSIMFLFGWYLRLRSGRSPNLAI